MRGRFPPNDRPKRIGRNDSPVTAAYRLAQRRNVSRVPASPLDVPAAFTFLRALAKNNDRAWFADHRAAYDAAIKPQFEEFVAALLIAAVTLDERFARVEPRECTFRIYRDTRFGHDKTPYKTALSAFMSANGRRGMTPGYYISLEPGGKSLFAAGIYLPQKPVLADLRRRVGDDDSHFTRLLASKALGPYLPLDTDPLVRMPRGFDADHPRGEFIRARRFIARRALTDRELTGANPIAVLLAAMRATAPLVGWLDRSSGRSLEPLDPAFE